MQPPPLSAAPFLNPLPIVIASPPIYPQFVHDQDLVEQYFRGEAAAEWREPWHVLTALPDAYNYKVCSVPSLCFFSIFGI